MYPKRMPANPALWYGHIGQYNTIQYSSKFTPFAERSSNDKIWEFIVKGERCCVGKLGISLINHYDRILLWYGMVWYGMVVLYSHHTRIC